MNHRSYFLELCSPDDFRPQAFAVDGIRVAQIRGADFARGRRLWTEVGRGFWNEREEWPDTRWQSHLNDERISFWVAGRAGEDIGFFELVRDGDELKLEGFGLLPAWREHGLGAGLLSAATQQAFGLGARRIWLHTATDDHPHALPNYLKRGYRVYREEALQYPMPGQSESDG